MIIKFKIFEELENAPEVDEYVVIRVNTFDEDFDNFINNTIFTVVSVHQGDYHSVRLKCDYVPKKFDLYFFENNEIIYLTSLIIAKSKNKEDLKYILAQNKYNL